MSTVWDQRYRADGCACGTGRMIFWWPSLTGSRQVETVQADLAELRIEPLFWSGIVAIFAHLPSAVRTTLHQMVVQILGRKPATRDHHDPMDSEI